MKFLFDLLPVILFFVAYKFANIFVATGVVIAATIAQVAFMWFKYRKVEPMLWVSLALVIIFGGATLVLHDENFIKLKLTIFYWLFAAVLLGASVFMGKNLIRALLASQAQLELPDPVWQLLNQMWIGFFIFMGALNLFIARTFSTDVWVDFKLFGSFGLLIVFLIVQGVIISKHSKD
ncbi:MAG TPA: septation protein A [Rhodocyclaceae bacterium]|jgi:intracellular septation protein|nr:septation protein A [Rhodocyclaceae bacterium]